MNAVDKALSEKMCVTGCTGNSCSGTVAFDAAFPGFQGHFPDFPVLPGVCCIAAVKCLMIKALNIKLSVVSAKKTKFFHAVRPGETLSIKTSFSDGSENGVIDTESMIVNDSGERVSKLKISFAKEASV